MQGEFPSTTFTDVTTGSGNTLIVDMSTNGDDGYQVVIDGSIASQFGATETDGTGTAWEHLDSLQSAFKVLLKMERLILITGQFKQ